VEQFCHLINLELYESHKLSFNLQLLNMFMKYANEDLNAR